MQTLELNAEEFELLCDLVHRGISEIDIEVSHTDTHQFRDMLKQRRAILQRLLAKLGAEPVRA
jgi:hypothetical protein